MGKKENKPFDKILKENLEELFLSITDKWLGFKIIKSTVLPEKLQTTLEREPDFIRIVETDQSEKFMLHLEFQSTNDADMVYRQAEYRAILQKKYKLPVRQFVIYLGDKRPTMQTQLPPELQIIGFKLLDIQQQDYRKLVSSEVPEEIMLAILGDFRGEAPEEVIQQIVNRLQKISRGELELQKYIRQLNMLSKLHRLEEQTIKITEAMPIVYDIETDYAYKRGIEKGIERGEEKERSAAQQQKRELFLKMLQDGMLTVDQLADYLSEQEVVQIQKEWEEGKSQK